MSFLKRVKTQFTVGFLIDYTTYIIEVAQTLTGPGKTTELSDWLEHNKGKHMNITKLFLLLTAVFVLVFAVAVITHTLTPDATVTTPEVKQTGDYRRPVREGNCYRHFTPTGTVLACG